MIKILHFADAHIDIANYGSHDPHSGLPMRVIDFLKSLDTIVDTAITEEVDLVVFAGDAYKDRSPAPTFQREWGRRIMRLSRAGIPTLLLIGNHDLSPAHGRAHALEAFDTLEVPNVYTLDKPQMLGPGQLQGLPVQVMALPWITRSALVAQHGLNGINTAQVHEKASEVINNLVSGWLDQADPLLPRILTAHCSVQGALYGNERTVMLGTDLVLPGSLMRDPRLDYVALGHIHKNQDLNPGSHPPVIYPGSIERVDFGEAKDDKFFVIAEVGRGATHVSWHKLDQIRPFIDCNLSLKDNQNVSEQIRKAFPPAEQLEGAIVRLVLEYPREWEALIDDSTLRDFTAGAFEFHLVKRPQLESRIRIPGDQSVSSMSPLDLLDLYWRTSHTDLDAIEPLMSLAQQIIEDPSKESG